MSKAALSSAAAAVQSAARAAKPALDSPQELTKINTLLSQVRKGKVPIPIPNRLTPVRTWAEERRRLGLPPAVVLGELREEVRAFEAKPLKPKRVADSLVELQLNFSSDASGKLTEDYIATSGLIRHGRIFEDLDGMAGHISTLYSLGYIPTRQDRGSPIITVTASVDRMDLLRPMSPFYDYHLIGATISVGRSTMEVLLAIEEINPRTGNREIVLTGIFTMAARNALTNKAQPVPPLELETPEEKQLSDIAQAHKAHKKQVAKSSLDHLPPTQEEAALLHEQYLQDRVALQSSMASTLIGGPLGSGAGSSMVAPSEGLLPATNAKDKHAVVTMSSTAMSSCVHMHPQQTNAHWKVFGGELLKLSYELAWMDAAAFANAPVRFLSLDTLSFHNPVNIGAALSMTSKITYTSQSQIKAEGRTGDPVLAAVTVEVEIMDLDTGSRTKSNSFHFTFEIGQTKRRVSPYTYGESIEWLESRRRVLVGDKLREARNAQHYPAIPPSETAQAKL